MVGTEWATSHPDCMDRLRKHHSGWFLARKVASAERGCMTMNSADYCMLVNEWAWLNSRVCLLRLKVNMVHFWKRNGDNDAFKACIC